MDILVSFNGKRYLMIQIAEEETLVSGLPVQSRRAILVGEDGKIRTECICQITVLEDNYLQNSEKEVKNESDMRSFEWNDSNIKEGMYVCKPQESTEENGWSAKWTHKISWGLDGSKLLSLTSMTDGMIFTPEDMVSYLNENGMIPMPKKRLIEMISKFYPNYE